MVWYYHWLDLSQNKVIKGGKLINQKDYMGYIESIYINDVYAAILSDGKCFLHTIDPNNSI